MVKNHLLKKHDLVKYMNTDKGKGCNSKQKEANRARATGNLRIEIRTASVTQMVLKSTLKPVKLCALYTPYSIDTYK